MLSEHEADIMMEVIEGYTLLNHYSAPLVLRYLTELHKERDVNIYHYIWDGLVTEHTDRSETTHPSFATFLQM